ncbi:MAG: D-2-hydroxyacid dehydrogenase, partial [Firmicutes bacterium]|nr:D-2-hydroxyacid dehydrogenase [Bacillota bacterium]
MKIVVLDGYTLNPGDLTWERLEKLGELTVYDRTAEDEILQRIGDAEIIYTNKTPLTRDTFEKAPQIKYVGVLATGYNVVDVEAAKEKGIPVTNIPTYGTTAVAQMTFALLLEMCHHVWVHSEEVKKGAWTNASDFCFWNYPLIELGGKTMGLIGYGRIGQAVGAIAQAFGMNVLAYDEYPNKALENAAMQYAALDELLAASDIVS